MPRRQPRLRRIEYTCSRPTVVSIGRRASVARLDEFVGPKY